MLERDRRPQLISVVDVVGVDGLPPPLPRSQYVFAAVWAAGADIAVVYGASSSWSKDLSSPISTRFSITAVFSPTSQRG
jgi:hypothetical protein